MTQNRTDIRDRHELPRRRALSSSTYDIVKELLMDLTIEPGSRINMDQLARDLEVSNTPLREALSRLEAEGLVTRRPLQGYSASPLLDRRQLTELFSLRILLEPEATKNATKNEPVEPLVEELEQTVAEMKRLIHEPRLDQHYHWYRAFAEADARFHQAISSACGNRLLHATLVGSNAHVHNYRLFFRSGMAPETTREHGAVVDAIKDRRSMAAASAMRRHLRLALGRLLVATGDGSSVEGDDGSSGP